MTMPIALGLVDRRGRRPAAASQPTRAPPNSRRGVFALEGARRSIVFTGVKRRPALSALRGFSAPVRVDDDLTEDDLTIAAQARQRQFQSLAGAAEPRDPPVAALGRRDPRRAARPRSPGGFIDAYGSVVDDALAGRIDPAFAALALILPGEADLAREIGRDVDPDAIRAARESLRGALGRAHADRLAALHDSMADPRALQPRRRRRRPPRAAQRRAGDVRRGQRDRRRRSAPIAQFADADNMTEKLGALAALSTIPGPAREHALDAFARRYAAEPLILDKWFALQAQIAERGTLDRVRALMNHHAFSLANPNRVRALIGGFTANQTQFNRADGAGYDLLAEIVLTLDPTNPQIAARLLTAMRSWRSLEPARRERRRRRCGASRPQSRTLRGCARHRHARLPESTRSPVTAQAPCMVDANVASAALQRKKFASTFH